MAMTATELADALTRTGFKKQDQSTESALKEYQRFWKLPPNATLDPITERSLNLERFCGLPDKMELGLTTPKWNKKHLVWVLQGNLPGIGQEQFGEAFRSAFDLWSAVCNITHEQATSSSQNIDIVINTGRIDGPFGTLAWSELPSGNQQKQQKYDHQERWVISQNPPQAMISLITVAAHELGHMLGLPHTGTPHQLMNPTYNPLLNAPQKNWDIAEVVDRYGRPVAPPVPPVGPGTESIVLGTRKGTVKWDA